MKKKIGTIYELLWFLYTVLDDGYSENKLP